MALSSKNMNRTARFEQLAGQGASNEPAGPGNGDVHFHILWLGQEAKDWNPACAHGTDQVEKQPSRAHFRFYAQLNDHLRRELQFRSLEKSFFTPAAVKDLIESFGVPHTEIDLIVANGRPVDFSYLVQDGDRIAVYPTFESFDIGGEQRLRSAPLRNPKFILDVHLGKLAAYLRMLGFDAEYGRSLSDDQLAQISAAEHRILLTRDRGLLKRGSVTHGYWVRETDSRRQLAEITARLQLGYSVRPFTRCMACNGVLEPITKQEA